jgi:hypothetical protein
MATAKPEILMDRKTFPHPVEMDLTKDELLAYGTEAADLAEEENQVTKRHQSEKGKFKSDIERIAGRRSVVLNRIRTKREHRDVECYAEYDYFAGMADIKRVDTDELIMSRKMTVEEFKGDTLPFLVPDDEEEQITVDMDWTEGDETGDDDDRG